MWKVSNMKILVYLFIDFLLVSLTVLASDRSIESIAKDFIQAK